MKSIDDFLQELQASPTVARLRNLKRIIEENPEYFRIYGEYLTMQKRYVQRTHPHSIDTQNEALADRLALITSDPVVGEYLFLVEELNETIQTIQEFITVALANSE